MKIVEILTVFINGNKEFTYDLSEWDVEIRQDDSVKLKRKLNDDFIFIYYPIFISKISYDVTQRTIE